MDNGYNTANTIGKQAIILLKKRKNKSIGFIGNK